MISCIDGPAAGQHLFLQRAPFFLRFVRSKVSGKWDALDQLHDVPGDDEEIFVYELIDKPSFAFVDYRDKRTGKRCGTSTQIGRYRVVTPQPTDNEMRTKAAWDAWCTANADRYEAFKAQGGSRGK